MDGTCMRASYWLLTCLKHLTGVMTARTLSFFEKLWQLLWAWIYQVHHVLMFVLGYAKPYPMDPIDPVNTMNIMDLHS